MSERKGTISVETADIFPIIKKWLYSEHDIFLRELITNATDAITKRHSIGRTLNQEIPSGAIDIRIAKSRNEMQIIDNGVGMTEEEVEKYLACLAFSGAEEFIKKMEDTKDDIIGKFGLGFYSSFMVAEKVTVDSLSMNEGAVPIRWSCCGDTDYTFSDSDRTEPGTTITLTMGKDGEEFLNEYTLSETVRKFCSFLPYSISLLNTEKEPEKPRKEDGSVDEAAEAIPVKPIILNNTSPLWKRDPKSIGDDEYKNFYQELFPTEFDSPLFWLHLKVDHPFTLEGILYFPKINLKKMSPNDHNIHLYCKQVFVSDNVTNIIPDFLSLLKGIIDSSDIPLNVSRSSLQGDPNIKKISNYVVKKVAESLKKLFNKDREKYENIWKDIAPFVKYGCISDDKFDKQMRERVIFKTPADKWVTLPEYRQSLPSSYKEKIGDKVLYYEQGQYDPSLCALLTEDKIYPLEMDDHIDPHFMQHVEYKKVGEQSWQFTGTDAEVGNLLDTENQTPEDVKVKELFDKMLGAEKKEGEEASKPSSLEIEIQKLKNAAAPAWFKTDEQMKRMAKMSQSMGHDNAFPLKRTLVLNPGNPLIQNALKIHEKGEHPELVEKICHHVEDLAAISVDGLNGEGRDNFIKRSQELMGQLTGLAL